MKLQKIIKEHIIFLNDNVTSMDAKIFVNIAKFMVEDNFHRNMLESQQIGLSYYLYTAAKMSAVKE